METELSGGKRQRRKQSRRRRAPRRVSPKRVSRRRRSSRRRSSRKRRSSRSLQWMPGRSRAKQFRAPAQNLATFVKLFRGQNRSANRKIKLSKKADTQAKSPPAVPPVAKATVIK